MISLCVGRIGSGKTLLQSVIGYQAFCAGETVYSNTPLAYDAFYQLQNPGGVPPGRVEALTSPEQLFQLQNCVVLLDEIHLFLDSRNFGGKQQIMFTHWLTLIRHFGIQIFATTQDFDQVDIRFRGLCSFILIAQDLGDATQYDIIDKFSMRKINSVVLMRDPRLFLLFDSHDKQGVFLDKTTELARLLVVRGGGSAPPGSDRSDRSGASASRSLSSGSRSRKVL